MKLRTFIFGVMMALLVGAMAGSAFAADMPIMIGEGDAAIETTGTLTTWIDGVETSRTVTVVQRKKGAAGEHILIDASPLFKWFSDKRRAIAHEIADLQELDAMVAEVQAIATGGQVAAIDGATSGVLNWKYLPVFSTD